MIRLQRTRTEAVIPSNFRGEKRLEKALTLLVQAGAKRDFDSSYWRKAKKQLKAETHDKCAYCEAPVATVAHGDVEHFRPKSTYWWLAYCYDNYLYSCQICNESFKGNKFPLETEENRTVAPMLTLGLSDAQKREFVRLFAPDPLDDAAGMPWATFEEACRAEGTRLLNPYVDDPEQFFAWEADEVLKEVLVRPRDPAVQSYYETAEQVLGLNRDELRRARWKTFEDLSTFRRVLESPMIDPALQNEVRAIIQKMMAANAGFAGMCRYFVRQVWQLAL